MNNPKSARRSYKITKQKCVDNIGRLDELQKNMMTLFPTLKKIAEKRTLEKKAALFSGKDRAAYLM